MSFLDLYPVGLLTHTQAVSQTPSYNPAALNIKIQMIC